ncbi:MAG: glycosyltransferase [Phycisphaerales bacterium]|nr:MAG: glycosyltransferase [Phycisphaerales bacterium]
MSRDDHAQANLHSQVRARPDQRYLDDEGSPATFVAQASFPARSLRRRSGGARRLDGPRSQLRQLQYRGEIHLALLDRTSTGDGGMNGNALQNVSVVAIGRNEGDRLRRCLESVTGRVAAVVYVDSGSTDGSVALARRFGAEIVELDPSTPFTAARARNAGVARILECHDDVEFVQVVDGDCQIVDGWLEAALEEMRNRPDAAIVCGCRRELHPEASPFNRLCDMEWNTPIGDTAACGGDALIRVKAFNEVGGYEESLIAGEEPEMCLRLRREDWRILRIDHDMTLHDARMTSFGQWWRRTVRCGHAYAEGRAMHGKAAERFRVDEVRSIIDWALLIPLVALVTAWITWGFSLAVVALYPMLWWRVRRDRIATGDPPGHAGLYASSCVIGKFPQLVGVAQYWLNRQMGRRSRLIEYKATPGGGGGGSVQTRPSILYLGGTLPKRSETFVYREVLALREAGYDVPIASVHPPECELGDARVDRLADEAIGVYGPGRQNILTDASWELLAHPLRSVSVCAMGVFDTLFGRDVRWNRRFRLLWQCLAGMALARRVRNLNVCHIHAHMAHVPTAIAMYCSRQLGITFSFTGHAADIFRLRALLPAKLRRARFVICISRWHRSFYQRIVPLPDERLPIVRCGVDVDGFSPATDGEESERFRILAVGRLVEKKGFDILIQALGGLACEGRQFECRIIGDGPQRGALTELVHAHGLAEQVELLGARDNEQVRQFMRESDLFVLPCRIDPAGDRDGIPVVLMEAMASQICAVSGDLPTIRELIANLETGVLVEPDDVGRLGRTLRGLMDDSQWRAKLARAGREWVAKEFSADVNMERLISAFVTASLPAGELGLRCAGDHSGSAAAAESVVARSDGGAASPAPMVRCIDGKSCPETAKSRRYVLITPCRDEAAYLRTTIESVAAQTVPPTKWVIVDDGSTDDTPRILAEAAEEYPFIEIIRREDRGRRAVGPGVIEAFYAGLESINLDDYDYVCKFDGDLELTDVYFQRVMERFEADPWLGTLSGKLYLRYGDRLVHERCGDENSVGPAKFYRVRCFREIGGFVRQVSWDGIDGHMCRMNGWIAGSIDDEDLRIIHLRRMGSSQRSFWTGRLRWGRGKYYMGSAIYYVLAVSAYRMLERPFVLSGLGILLGYLQAMLRREQRFNNEAYRRFFRKYELRSLLFGKRRTTNKYHDRIRTVFPLPNPVGVEETTTRQQKPAQAA